MEGIKKVVTMTYYRVNTVDLEGDGFNDFVSKYVVGTHGVRDGVGGGVNLVNAPINEIKCESVETYESEEVKTFSEVAGLVAKVIREDEVSDVCLYESRGKRRRDFINFNYINANKDRVEVVGNYDDDSEIMLIAKGIKTFLTEQRV